MERAPDNTSIEERLIAAAALFGFTSILAGWVPSTTLAFSTRTSRRRLSIKINLPTLTSKKKLCRAE